MSVAIGELYHPVNSAPEKVYKDFSWPCLLFGVFWYLYKSMWVWSLIAFGAACFTAGLSWFVFPFFANRQHYDSLLRRGYHSKEQLARAPSTASGNPSANVTSAVGELTKLADLLRQGLITREEFDAQKKQLLAGDRSTTIDLTNAGVPDAASFPANPSVSSRQAANSPEPITRPRLWNPNAAANWSVLFTAALGAVLHAKNWQALGELRKVKRAWAWAVVGGLLLIATIAAPISLAKYFAFWNFVLLIGWYFISARPQSKLVTERFGEGYAHRGWWGAIAAMALVLLTVFGQLLLTSTQLKDDHAVLNTPERAARPAATVPQPQQAIAASPVAAAPPSQHARLRELAINDLHKSKYSGARPEALCDVVSDEVYDPVSYGNALRAPGYMGSAKAFPAIIIRHEYICINRTLGTKERQEQWVILALDEEMNMLRCPRTGPLYVVFGLADDCDFQPEDGRSPFPSAEVIADSAPELIREKVLANAQSKLSKGAASVENAASSDNAAISSAIDSKQSVPSKGIAAARASTPAPVRASMAREWVGTMSCGELQNAPKNALKRDPFVGDVTLRIDSSNHAVLVRSWETGTEELQGTIKQGQPVALDGSGWRYSNPGGAWRTRALLALRSERIEGSATIETKDSSVKYRDCTIRLKPGASLASR